MPLSSNEARPASWLVRIPRLKSATADLLSGLPAIGGFRYGNREVFRKAYLCVYIAGIRKHVGKSGSPCLDVCG